MSTQEGKSDSRWVALRVLMDFWRKKTYVAQQLHNEFRRNRVAPQDRPFITELVLGSIRWYLYLDWILRQFVHEKYDKIPLSVRMILHLSLYQKLFLSRVPDYAIVNEAIKLVRGVKQFRLTGFVNGVLRNILRSLDSLNYPEGTVDPEKALSILYSFPQWMVKRWLKRYGLDFTRALLDALNQPPGIGIRVNGLKTTRDQYFAVLKEHGIEARKGRFLREFLLVERSRGVERFPLYREGYFSVQDESAGLVAHVLAPQPGETVLDLCAAPGGKTTHLAELMQNRGKIIAVDLYAHRLEILSENAARLGISCIETVQADGRFLKREPVDRILLDAPCSGLGVISRKPDIKWRRTLQDIREMSALQFELLENAARLLKVGGVLAYSTCTIEPEENEEQITGFLKEHPEFVREPAQPFVGEIVVNREGFVQTFPHIHKVDGSFVARLVKKKNK